MALTHTTRNRPRRADEVLAGGSLYWVIKGIIRARQPIIGLDDVTERMGRKACQIVLGPEEFDPGSERTLAGMLNTCKSNEKQRRTDNVASAVDSIQENLA